MTSVSIPFSFIILASSIMRLLTIFFFFFLPFDAASTRLCLNSELWTTERANPNFEDTIQLVKSIAV